MKQQNNEKRVQNLDEGKKYKRLAPDSTTFSFYAFFLCHFFGGFYCHAKKLKGEKSKAGEAFLGLHFQGEEGKWSPLAPSLFSNPTPEGRGELNEDKEAGVTKRRRRK